MRLCNTKCLTRQSGLRYLFGTMRYCPEPGCAAKVKRGRCPAHTTRHYQRDRYARGTAAERGYDARWRRIRDHKLRLDPLCEPCESEGKARLADMVHHRVPLRSGGTHALSNLQSVCNPCHQRLHVAMGRG